MCVSRIDKDYYFAALIKPRFERKKQGEPHCPFLNSEKKHLTNRLGCVYYK